MAKSKPAESKASPWTKPKPKPASFRRRVAFHSEQPSQTRASFAPECDVNRILDRFQRTGMLTHTANGKAVFAEAPDQGLFEAACTIAELKSEAEYREAFDNSPQAASERLRDENPAPEGVDTPPEETPEIPPEGASDDES